MKTIIDSEKIQRILYFLIFGFIFIVPFGVVKNIKGIWITSNDVLTCVILILWLYVFSGKDKNFRDFPLVVPILLFLSSCLLSLLNSASIFLALKETAKFVFIFFLFYIFVFNIQKKSLGKIPFIITITATLVSIWAIYDFLSGRIIIDDRLWNDKFAPYGHLNALATYLVITIPFSFNGIFEEHKFWMKLCFSFSLVTQIVAMVLTFSRGSWIGLVIGVTVLFLVFYRFRGFIFLTVFLTLFLLAGILFVPGLQLLKRVSSITDVKNDGSIVSRLEHMDTAFKMIKKYPLTGIGAGNFQIAAKKMYGRDLTEMTHNIFLHVGAEMGVLSIVSLLWIILAYLKRIIQEYKISTDKNYRKLLVIVLSSFIGLMVTVQFGDPFVYKIKEYFALLLAIPFCKE